MPDTITLNINGRPINVSAGVTVAAAILTAGNTSFRRSVTGQPRGPLCGMGICFECRASIDGVLHRRTCQLAVRAGMEIETQ
jgi:sarcosine oxidase subunit alpha